MKILGIDPGNRGALATIQDGKLTGMIEMPLLKGMIDYDRLASIIKNTAPDRTYVERVSALHVASKKATFGFGRGFGAIQGILTALRIPYMLVDPKVWQKPMHEGIEKKKYSAKEKSAIAAVRLFPGWDFRRRGGLHDGLIDAALIALYGYQHCAPHQPGALAGLENALKV